MAGLWIVLLLLASTCYAENTENPIISEGYNGYLRLNIPSVKKIEYYGRSYIECSYTQHHKMVLPYGIPIVEETGTYYCWFDPSDDKMWAFGEKHYDASKDYVREYLNKRDISGDYSIIYRYLLNNFPKLCDEAKLDNQKADEKYGSYLAKAFAAENNKDWEAEYAALKEAYDNGCQSQAILYDFYWICWKIGEYDNAIDWVSKRIEVAPSAAAYNSRAWDYYLLGKNDLALEDAKWATLKDKDEASYLDTRGCIYYEMGQYDKAIKDFDAALKINDQYAHAYYYRGKCYEAIGKKNDAQSDYKKANEYKPGLIDDKADFANQRSQAQARKQQAQYQRREKYKEDLKKLNDAIYVTNNANNFSKLDICEQNRVIINVADAIKNNEPEEFYEEVIPQAVRINYENGTYQQQYEQLKAELGITNTPSVVAKEVGIKIGADGTILEAPTTLPTDSSKEIFDLRQPNQVLSYESEGSKYILTYEDPMITYRALKGNEVTPLEQEHGRYMLRHVVEYGDPYPDFSFDYDRASHTFTLYGGAGAKRTVHYDSASDTITVNHLNGAYSDLSGTYVYVPVDDSYILYPRNRKLEANAVALAKEPFNGDSDIGKHYTVYYGPAIDLEVIAYPEYKEQRPNLPDMWYKMTNVEYPSDWIAFTYDKATGVFDMYQNDDKKIVNYSKRWFRDANTIETHLTDTPMNGADDGIYVRDSNGQYRRSGHSNYINKYITDGMFNFMHYVKK